jgi:hypothetical protein
LELSFLPVQAVVNRVSESYAKFAKLELELSEYAVPRE